METIQLQDYSLVGKSAKDAVDKGLAEADWYTSPVPREEMRQLLVRKDWPAIRDSIIWFGLLIGFAMMKSSKERSRKVPNMFRLFRHPS